LSVGLLKRLEYVHVCVCAYICVFWC
jgi:hypothetical protein